MATYTKSDLEDKIQKRLDFENSYRPPDNQYKLAFWQLVVEENGTYLVVIMETIDHRLYPYSIEL